MKLRPARGKAFVRLDKDEEKTAGGLYVPEASRGDKSEGVVIAVGLPKLAADGKTELPIPVGEGNRVVMPKYGGEKVKPLGIDEGDLKSTTVIVDTDDILAVWEP